MSTDTAIKARPPRNSKEIATHIMLSTWLPKPALAKLKSLKAESEAEDAVRDGMRRQMATLQDDIFAQDASIGSLEREFRLDVPSQKDLLFAQETRAKLFAQKLEISTKLNDDANAPKGPGFSHVVEFLTEQFRAGVSFVMFQPFKDEKLPKDLLAAIADARTHLNGLWEVERATRKARPPASVIKKRFADAIRRKAEPINFAELASRKGGILRFPLDTDGGAEFVDTAALLADVIGETIIAEYSKRIDAAFGKGGMSDADWKAKMDEIASDTLMTERRVEWLVQAARKQGLAAERIGGSVLALLEIQPA